MKKVFGLILGIILLVLPLTLGGCGLFCQNPRRGWIGERQCDDAAIKESERRREKFRQETLAHRSNYGKEVEMKLRVFLTPLSTKIEKAAKLDSDKDLDLIARYIYAVEHGDRDDYYRDSGVRARKSKEIRLEDFSVDNMKVKFSGFDYYTSLSVTVNFLTEENKEIKLVFNYGRNYDLRFGHVYYKERDLFDFVNFKEELNFQYLNYEEQALVSKLGLYLAQQASLKHGEQLRAALKDYHDRVMKVYELRNERERKEKEMVEKSRKDAEKQLEYLDKEIEKLQK